MQNCTLDRSVLFLGNFLDIKKTITMPEHETLAIDMPMQEKKEGNNDVLSRGASAIRTNTPHFHHLVVAKHTSIQDYLKLKVAELTEHNQSEDEVAEKMFATFIQCDECEKEGEASTTDLVKEVVTIPCADNDLLPEVQSKDINLHEQFHESSFAPTQNFLGSDPKLFNPWLKGSNLQIDTQSLEQTSPPDARLLSPFAPHFESERTMSNALIAGFAWHLSKRALNPRLLGTYVKAAEVFNQFVMDAGCSISELLSNEAKRNNLRAMFSQLRTNDRNAISGLVRYCNDFLPDYSIDMLGNLVIKPVLAPQKQDNEMLPSKRKRK